MAEIKPLAKIAAKWKRNTGTAGDSYREGVESPRRPWEAATIAADDARKEGLAAADARGAVIDGVRKAGDAKWKKNSVALGPARFRQGTANAEPEYVQGFTKYHATIASVTLPPRGPKGSPENIDRVRAIADALHTARVSG